MEIIWIGHSCFKIKNGNYSIVIDPYKAVPGLKEIKECANMVLVTHGHSDHNALNKVEIEEATSDFTVTSIELSHDDQGGKVRGENKGYIIESGKYKIAHLGDVGCKLTDEQINELKCLDVLFLPVGGIYTINGKEAAQFIDILKPKIAIPMHYKDLDYGFGFEKLEEINIFINNVNRVKAINESRINLKSLSLKRKKLFEKYKTDIIILKPQNAIVKK